MSHLASHLNDDLLIESSLPVELQSSNVIHPAYNLSAIPVSVINGGADHLSSRGRSYNGVSQGEPHVIITEQPQQRGFRFRYECEGPSHGGLQGTKSERSKKSYPTIKVENYIGALRVVVSLVTDEKTPRSHAHKLVGTNCKNGFCTIEIKDNSESISFPNICILHVTRKKLVDVLTERILDTIKLNKKLAANNMNIDQPITEEDQQVARQQAEDQSKNMQLSVVRLCFQVFLRNPDGTFSKMLPPIVSQPIYDSKSPGASALKICRMDKYGGCCSGNEEVFLLCEKVQKGAIDGFSIKKTYLISAGTLQSFDPTSDTCPPETKEAHNHHSNEKYAIVFKTPAYWNTNIDKAVNVLIMLQRKSDKEVSEPKAFTYFPQNRDKDNIASKKRKRIPLDGYDFGGDGGGGGYGGPGLGGDGSNGGSGDGILDPSGPGGIGGVLSGSSGGNGNNNSYMMMMQGNGIHNAATSLPTLVQEAARNPMYSRRHVQLDSDRLRVAIRSGSSPHEMLSTNNDPWINSEEIEVDAVPLSPQYIVEDNLSQPQKFPEESSANFDDEKKMSNLIQATKPPERGPQHSVSLQLPESPKVLLDTRLDSALGQSIQFEDQKTVRETDRRHGAANEDKEDASTNKSFSLCDYQSEADVKLGDALSTGMRSDEGFSETSEEVAHKDNQHISSNKKKEKSIHFKGMTQPSQLSDAVRDVTGRVAKRTITALIDYAETGDIRHLLLVQRQLMTISNKNGDLPLHLSVINSQPEALKSLVDVMCTLQDSKLHINALNHMRQTPLHIATIMDQPTIVETLLHAGADPSIADRHGNTAAHLAVANGAHRCLASLVKYLRPGQTKANPFPELNYLNFDGYSPVHLVAQSGNVNMLRILIYAQADINLPDGKSGKTALHHAVDNNDLPIAGFLLTEARTFVNARCFDGNTALHIACARQLVAMVALLITAGADQECENEEIPDPEESEVGGKAGSKADSRALDRLGMRPVDYANENEEILKILQGQTEPDSFLLDSHSLADSDEAKVLARLSLIAVKDNPASMKGAGLPSKSELPFGTYGS
ncbi:nuclear factor NF-kappa-b p105 subunit [Plakobranchus ocellatus]|uniref:Nuclear factor NF-kappa-b p105 subunit n=1 Tax=Plakobranchus ocellatus TaxID=259542 RepID=A0AAV3Z0Z2_9GAST|nr:nuclear factor NF-kappa-b p105 subunit [Plakobranchus ocellatus]